LRERGYHQYTQNVSAMDYTPITAAQIVQNVMAGAGDGAIVSFHTQEMQTAIALRTLIPLLLAQGYQFGLVC
jgi:peptidoglycan/xylan/chitin deacetylase (PgdA/CDA1 family)